MARRTGGGPWMISVVAQRYGIHPQTLRLYEREGLLKPSRTDGNTRLYGEEDVERLETILSLTRDLGVNLAGVEIILNMREKMARMQHEVNEFMHYVKQELARGVGDWEQRLGTALVKSHPSDLVRPAPAGPREAADGGTGETGGGARRTERPPGPDAAADGGAGETGGGGPVEVLRDGASAADGGAGETGGGGPVEVLRDGASASAAGGAGETAGGGPGRPESPPPTPRRR